MLNLNLWNKSESKSLPIDHSKMQNGPLGDSHMELPCESSYLVEWDLFLIVRSFHIERRLRGGGRGSKSQTRTPDITTHILGPNPITQRGTLWSVEQNWIHSPFIRNPMLNLQKTTLEMKESGLEPQNLWTTGLHLIHTANGDPSSWRTKLNSEHP